MIIIQTKVDIIINIIVIQAINVLQAMHKKVFLSIIQPSTTH
jgi:hypothetical protein